MAYLAPSSSMANSSPSSDEQAIFSDEPTRASSPPSSPPGFPWELQNSTPNESQNTSKNAFSILGKRVPLNSLNDNNARPTKKRAPNPKPPSTAGSGPGKRPLSQMQISLGQKTQRKCPTCGMEYVPSSSEDRKLHDKYHKQNTEGFDVGKDFLLNKKPGSFSYTRVFAPRKVGEAGDVVTTVDERDKAPRKRRARGVLDVVQRELGAVEITDRELWAEWWPTRESRYTCYLYLRGTRCIGFLLAEYIREARTVILPEALKVKEEVKGGGKGTTALDRLRARRAALAEPAATFPVRLSEEAVPAFLGVSRIWVSPQHRHQNIGTRLLDTAYSHYNDSVEDRLISEEWPGYRQWLSSPVENRGEAFRERMHGREMVAFSQPTEMGAALARKWFGRNYGWKVYVS